MTFSPLRTTTLLYYSNHFSWFTVSRAAPVPRRLAEHRPLSRTTRNQIQTLRLLRLKLWKDVPRCRSTRVPKGRMPRRWLWTARLSKLGGLTVCADLQRVVDITETLCHLARPSSEEIISGISSVR